MTVILFQGAFGTVSLVRKKDTGAYYALKMLKVLQQDTRLVFVDEADFNSATYKKT